MYGYSRDGRYRGQAPTNRSSARRPQGPRQEQGGQYDAFAERARNASRIQGDPRGGGMDNPGYQPPQGDLEQFPITAPPPGYKPPQLAPTHGDPYLPEPGDQGPGGQGQLAPIHGDPDPYTQGPGEQGPGGQGYGGGPIEDPRHFQPWPGGQGGDEGQQGGIQYSPGAHPSTGGQGVGTPNSRWSDPAVTQSPGPVPGTTTYTRADGGTFVLNNDGTQFNTWGMDGRGGSGNFRDSQRMAWVNPGWDMMRRDVGNPWTADHRTAFDRGAHEWLSGIQNLAGNSQEYRGAPGYEDAFANLPPGMRRVYREATDPSGAGGAEVTDDELFNLMQGLAGRERDRAQASAAGDNKPNKPESKPKPKPEAKPERRTRR